MPDFSRRAPLAEGVATNLSLAYRMREENCGLAVEGFIQIGNPGLYTFHLTSDDGSRLYAGKASVSSEVIGPPGQSTPAAESFEQALADRANHRGIEMEGEVAFVGKNQRSPEIENDVLYCPTDVNHKSNEDTFGAAYQANPHLLGYSYLPGRDAAGGADFNNFNYTPNPKVPVG
jgi:hypothetical protein